MCRKCKKSSVTTTPTEIESSAPTEPVPTASAIYSNSAYRRDIYSNSANMTIPRATAPVPTAPPPFPTAPVPTASAVYRNNIYSISATTTDYEIPPPSYEEVVENMPRNNCEVTIFPPWQRK